jgi:hypothetical protein
MKLWLQIFTTYHEAVVLIIESQSGFDKVICIKGTVLYIFIKWEAQNDNGIC